MAHSINIANVLVVDIEGASGLFAMDPSNGKVYRLPLEEADPATTGRVAMAVYGQMRRSMPDMPHKQISDVMKANESVAGESMNIFRRER
jgi:hypothetical protein